MSEIVFINAGYNVAEYKSLTFNRSLHRHAFLYFQGPVIVNGKLVGSGSCILYPEGSAHDYVTQNGFVNSYIGFKAPLDIFQKLSIKTNKIIYPTNCGEINEIIGRICRENDTRNLGYDVEIISLILKLLVAVSRGTNPSHPKENSEIKDLIIEIRNEYMSNLKEVPDIEYLITKYGLSRTRFYKMYTRYFHLSPKNDLIRARLERFRDLIPSNPDAKMYEIAAECGFFDMPSFFKTFKKWYGYTPREYANAVKSDSMNI